MKYLTKTIRREIAEVLAREHDYWIRYRDKQAPHPKPGVYIRRGIAEFKIKRLRELIKMLHPSLLEKPVNFKRIA